MFVVANVCFFQFFDRREGGPYQRLRLWAPNRGVSARISPMMSRKDLALVKRAKKMVQAKELHDWSFHPHLNILQVCHPSVVIVSRVSVAVLLSLIHI